MVAVEMSDECCIYVDSEIIQDRFNDMFGASLAVHEYGTILSVIDE